MQLELRNIRYAYPAVPDVYVLSGLNCVFRQDEIVGVVGKTGSGKTTLLQLCAGLLTPAAGEIVVDGTVMSQPKLWRKFRRKIGIAFQFPEKQLFEETVYRDVAFGVAKLFDDPEMVREYVFSALTQVGLPPEEFAERSPHRLSSGEKRRAAIAGIIASQPEMLFLDEPTIGLDQKGMAKVESIISQYRNKKKTVCIVSHNIDFIARIADRIIVLAGNTIRYDGLKQALFSDARLMRDMDVKIPEVVALCTFLSDRYNVDLSGVFRVEEVVQELERLNGTGFPV